MDRKSFLEILNRKLKKVDEEEREEVVLFYSELFDEMNLNEDDEIPKKYDIHQIARELNLSLKIDDWENENNTISKIFKSIPIISLSILSLPTIILALIIFLALILTAIFLIVGVYFTVYLFLIGTIKNFLISGISLASVILLIGILFLLVSATGFFIEFINLIGKMIVGKIKKRRLQKRGA